MKNNDQDLLKKISILIIEDNQGDFILIEDFLIEKYKTIDIFHRSNYFSAIDYLQNTVKKPSIILLDLKLPDSEGIDLINGVLNHSFSIPIMILTGYSDLPLAKKSLELGIYDFLIKDEINPTLLHKSIEYAISRSRYLRHIEEQNEKLKNIAWTQSHVVRAPIARMLGIINFIELCSDNMQDLQFWLEQLKISSTEIDEIVCKIVKETETLNFKR